MTQPIQIIRFAATLALASLGGISALAAQQTQGSDASDAADAAQQVANEAEDAIRGIDPTTGETSAAVDSALSLPSQVGVVPIEVLIVPDQTPPRGPAAQMIPNTVVQAPIAQAPFVQNPVVQELPAPDPVTPPASARTARAAQAPAQASADPFTIKSIMTIPTGPFRYGDWYWDENAAPATGKLVVTVDLDARVISAFRDGHEIGTAVALVGTQKHPTPLGTFPILTKEKDNISEKYDNAPMPWTLRLTWDGIAIHGSPVINGYASHGCIGVPEEFAAKLFAAARRGDKVVITRGKMIGVGDKIS